jgi:hypothetical protein
MSEQPEDEQQPGDEQQPEVTAEADEKKSEEAAAPARRFDLAFGLTAAEYVLALAVAFAFALSFGFNYGVSNQTTYLLLSKQVLDPALYKHDWLASETINYHWSFRYVGAALIALNKKGWAVAIGQTVAITGAMMFVHSLMRRLVRPPFALPAFVTLVAIAFATRTSSVAVTYVFDEILQPSTLGSVGLLAAAFFFAAGRYRHAGVAMALSGFFHANYLILLLGAFGIAHLLIGRERFWRRSLELFVAPVLVLLTFLPVILKSAGGGKEAELAQTFYMTVRSPHHFALGKSEAGFLASAAWAFLGLGFGGRVLAANQAARRLAAVLGGLLFVIGGGMMFSSLWKVRAANMLFAWRVMPHVELLCATLFVAGLFAAAAAPHRLRRAGPAAVASLIWGVALIAMFGGFHNRLSVPKQLMGVIAIAAFSGVVCYLPVLASGLAALQSKRPLLARARRVLGARVLPAMLMVGALGLFAGQASDKVGPALKKSNLMAGGDKNLEKLCGWVAKNTSKDAVFLTPPDHESFRFQCERAIVVDWKSPPIVPKELLAWIQRIQDVTGKKRITGRRDLNGYGSLDEKALARLRARYHFDYIVVRGGRRIGKLDSPYRGPGYSVIDARGLDVAVDAVLDDRERPAPDLDVDPSDVLPDDAEEDGIQAE